jgi:NitT/TauT family transport system ATP-binding protein
VFLSSRVAVFRGRPGRIVASLDIDTPDERDDAFRESPRYVELCLQASAALRRASET